jgi:hypothetical protein
MGTRRREKEAEKRAQQRQRQAEFTHKRRELQFAEADVAARIATLQLDLDKQRAELALYTADAADTEALVPGKHRVARISAGSRTNGEKEPRRGP